MTPPDDGDREVRVPLAALPLPGMLVDDGRIAAANTAAASLLGDGDAEREGGSGGLCGRPSDRVFPNGLPDGSEGSFRRVRTTSLDGDAVETAVTVSETGRGKLVLVFPMDRLPDGEAELRHFVSGISHDLKQPLSAVKGYLELLEPTVEQKLEQEHLDDLRQALDATARAENLLDGLLTYARVGFDEESEEVVELEAVLDDVVSDLRVQLDDPAASVEYGSLPAVRGPRSGLVQLFENLVSNGLKYQDTDPRRVELSAEPYADGDYHRVSVTDNGVGIEQGESEEIFELFERGSAGESVEGSGVGLALCQRVVEAVGGRIEAEPIPGEGSTFHVLLPAAEPAAEHGTDADADTDTGTDAAPRSVVLVDDVEGLRTLVRKILERTGRYQVVGEAGTGEAAIDVAAETEPDVVLLDLSMPKMDGLEALPHIKEVAPEADVVIYSGFEKGRMVEKAQERGAVGYIEKGADADEIVAQLREALDRDGSPA